jgi:hypothetical protein
MLFRIAVYSENHIVCGQNTELLNVCADGPQAYKCNWLLKR